MPSGWRGKGALQRARWVSLGAAGRNRESKNLPDGRPEPPRRFMPLARLDAPQDAQNFRRCYLGDRARAYARPGET